MLKYLRTWLPELALGTLLLFFAFRELGTFPAAWADDSLFMIIARSVAEGRGFSLPLLGEDWHFPYILAVGPTLIGPVALAIKLFGFSVAVARIPMALYVIGTAILFYIFTQRVAGRRDARWATALLITLSAFVNTGKPVMGEVPGLFFLLLGLLCLLHEEKTVGKWSAFAGISFGLSVLTKLTYGLIYPALILAWINAIIRRDWCTVRRLTMTGILALIIYVPWRFLEMQSQAGLLGEFRFLFGESETTEATPFLYLLTHQEILFRLPFLSYGVFLILGGIGLWKLRSRLPRPVGIVLATLIALFTLYFLSSFGWYRHLLPAHILLLTFVPAGATALCRRRFAPLVLAAIILLQGVWQWKHFGSSTSTEAAEAADFIQHEFADRDLIIQQADVFVRLEPNPHWLFLTAQKISDRLPERFVGLDEKQLCMPILRKLSEEEVTALADRTTQAVRRYYIIQPDPSNCSQP
ncbi:MAG: glycosyltransferase family 39 protein [Candidatus Peregrinibacteria bacterium]|nr:glycosyltransferase family 39 protein [Candidatus Peregrinibacteria bacterium]